MRVLAACVCAVRALQLTRQGSSQHVAAEAQPLDVGSEVCAWQKTAMMYVFICALLYSWTDWLI